MPIRNHIYFPFPHCLYWLMRIWTCIARYKRWGSRVLQEDANSMSVQSLHFRARVKKGSNGHALQTLFLAVVANPWGHVRHSPRHRLSQAIRLLPASLLEEEGFTLCEMLVYVQGKRKFLYGYISIHKWPLQPCFHPVFFPTSSNPIITAETNYHWCLGTDSKGLSDL